MQTAGFRFMKKILNQKKGRSGRTLSAQKTGRVNLMDADCINAESKSSECPHCGARDNFFTKEKSPHIGLYCRSCKRWSRWIRRRQAAIFSAKPAKSPPPLALAPRVETEPEKPANCGYCAEVSRLINHMSGIERHLEIVTRALMGAGAR
jgi:hypothetical protein